MKILNGAIMCGRFPLPQTRGQVVALYKSTIAPQLKSQGLDASHGNVRQWLMQNCNTDYDVAEMLTNALAYAVKATR